MLVRFVVSNYLSFGEEAEFNMLTGSPRRFKEHIYTFGELELLKTAAIYGANGAGKSNLVKAMHLLQRMVVGQWDPLTELQVFRLSDRFEQEPTRFEVEFIKEGAPFNYGISLLAGQIVEEWLYQTHPRKADALIFNRTTENGKTTIEVGDPYYRTPEDRLRIKLYEEELLSEHQPLLRQMAEARQAFPEVKLAHSWFANNLTIIFPQAKPSGMVLNFSRSPFFRNFANDLLRSLQTGVAGLELETIDVDQYFGEDDKEEAEAIKKFLASRKEGGYLQISSKANDVIAISEGGKVVVKRLFARHADARGNAYAFSLEEESDGTQRILDFIPALYEAIARQDTVIIDEIDQSIHPYLLKNLIAKFVQDEETKGQVVFTTHESNLLDQRIFRQDEIWFAEKKPTGETALYPLSDFDIRFDLDIQKGYLNGRFGAIPFLANLQDLNWEQYAAAE